MRGSGFRKTNVVAREASDPSHTQAGKEGLPGQPAPNCLKGTAVCRISIAYAPAPAYILRKRGARAVAGPPAARAARRRCAAPPRRGCPWKRIISGI